MSKAFTSEETADASIAGRVPQRAAPGHERPITPAGQARLRERLKELLEVERPAAAQLPPMERETRLAELDHRIALVDATLASVRVVEAPASHDTVGFGSHVTLAWDDGRTQSLQIVGPDETDARAGRISVDAPLARALLGLSVGDAAEVRLPRGDASAEILSIE